MSKRTIVRAYWIDSCGFNEGWVDNQELESLRPKEIETFGYLIQHNDDYVVIAPTIGDEQNFGSLCIPQCSVLKINILKESRDEMV